MTTPLPNRKLTTFLPGNGLPGWLGSARLPMRLFVDGFHPEIELRGEVARPPARARFQIELPLIGLKLSSDRSSTRRPGYAGQPKADHWPRQNPTTEIAGSGYRRPVAGPNLFTTLSPKPGTP